MFGTDIDNRGIVTSTGDIKLISEEENVAQAIKKRLLTRKGAYSYFDSDYGSILQEAKGYKKTLTTMELIALAIETESMKDPRISDCKCEYDLENKKLYPEFTLYDGTKFGTIIDLQGE
jgi:hypothetical protein